MLAIIGTDADQTDGTMHKGLDGGDHEGASSGVPGGRQYTTRSRRHQQSLPGPDARARTATDVDYPGPMPINVLVIVIDQLRRDGLGCYGDPITRTPAMDALAARGTRFTNCISTHPLCSPWRASLQTGRYAWHHGVQANNQRIDTSLPSLATIAQADSRHTAFFGKAHWWDSGKPGFYPPQARLGYQSWWGYNRGHFHWDTPDFDDHGRLTHAYAGHYEPTVATDRALDFIQAQAARPWLLCLNYGPPHNATLDAAYADGRTQDRIRRMVRARAWPIDDRILAATGDDDPPLVSHVPQHLVDRLVPEPCLGLYREDDFPDRSDIPASERALTAAMRREYSAMTTSVDDEIGRLLADIDLDRTLVVVTADHGDHLGAHGRRRGKASHLQAAWRTPLLMAGPGLAAGTVDQRLIGAIDLLPTICALAGLNPPPGLPGRDLAHQRHQALIGLGTWRALVTPHHCLAAQHGPKGWQPLQLSDLDQDPWDLHDRREAEPALTAELQQELLARLQEAGDPLGMSEIA